MTGEQIKQWREERGISRMELSRLTGVSYHSIQRWEIGKGSPSPMALIQLRQIMETKMERTKQIGECPICGFYDCSCPRELKDEKRKEMEKEGEK